MAHETVPVRPVYGDKEIRLLVQKGSRLEQYITKHKSFYEADLLEYIRGLGLGGTYVNVGAHVGNHSVFFAEYCACDEVISIEPDDFNYELLVENTKNRSKVKPLHRAACDVDHGHCPVSFGEKSRISKVDFKTRIFSKFHKCDCVTVDTLAVGKNVSVIKIDVHGDPSLVLEGSQKTINRCKPILAVDHGSGDSACNSSRVLGRLMYMEIARYGESDVSICIPATFHVVFPMFNRVDVTMNLLRDLDREVAEARKLGAVVDVTVYDDASTENVSTVVEFLEKRHWGYHRFEQNHGKKWFWEVVTKIFQDVSYHAGVDLLVLMANDMRISTKFFERILASWNSIADRKKAALNIQAEERRDHVAQWTNFPPQRHNELTWKTQWNDGVLVCPVKALKVVEFRIKKPPESRWDTPNISTGVWQWFSCELNNNGFGLYRTDESLTVHVLAPSSMHGDFRKKEPIVCTKFADGIRAYVKLFSGESVYASLASIPSRKENLRLVVDSLLPQVDQLRVYLNGYDKVPDFLNRDRVLVARSQEHGDRGDAGKFFWCEGATGYQLTCDDDLIYSDGYVLFMINAIERYARKAIVGLHGVILNSPPRNSYYDCRKLIMWSADSKKDQFVHLVGTGTLAYHSSAVNLLRSDFELPNMADIWLGLICQRDRIPVVCAAHRSDMLQLLKCEWTIYQRYRGKEQQQLDAVDRVPLWRVNKVSI